MHYEQALRAVFENGAKKTDRTGTGTKSLFGLQMRWDLTKGFPLVTTKKVHIKSVVAELLWMLSGSTNVQDLQAMGCTIWDEWAKPNGDLGPVYGHQWRSWPGEESMAECGIGQWPERKRIDQISEAIKLLKTDPDSRRIVVSAWNVADLGDMALAPCHCLFQFYTEELPLEARIIAAGQRGIYFSAPVEKARMHEHLDDLGAPRRRISCQLYQRSADMFLGVPFNIASYALLTHMVAQQVNMEVGEFVWAGGDCHIYDNHRQQVMEQLGRSVYDMPALVLNKAPDLFSYKPEDVSFVNYHPHPAIKGDVAV